jgi:hypothetical protein
MMTDTRNIVFMGKMLYHFPNMNWNAHPVKRLREWISLLVQRRMRMRAHLLGNLLCCVIPSYIRTRVEMRRYSRDCCRDNIAILT